MTTPKDMTPIPMIFHLLRVEEEPDDGDGGGSEDELDGVGDSAVGFAVGLNKEREELGELDPAALYPVGTAIIEPEVRPGCTERVGLNCPRNPEVTG